MADAQDAAAMAEEAEKKRLAASGIRALRRAELQEKLAQIRSESNRIELENASLVTQMDGQRRGDAEAYFYLQKKLEDNYENIAGLEARVSQDREMRARKNVEYEQKLLSTTSQNRDELAALSREKETLEGRVSTLAAFQAQRTELEARQAMLEEQLASVRAANQRASKDSIDRNEEQKNQLRREMRSKIAETKVNLMAQTEDMLPVATKRTIMENEKIRNELQYQSREASKLAARHHHLETTNAQLRKQLTQAKKSEVVAASKLHSRQKHLRRMQEQLQAMEEDRNEKRRHATVVDTEQMRALAEAEAELRRLMALIEAAEAEHERLLAPLETVSREHQQLMLLQCDFSRVVLGSVGPIMAQVARDHELGSGDDLSIATGVSSVTGPAPPQRPVASLAQLSAAQRDLALGLLLGRLHTCQLENGGVMQTAPNAGVAGDVASVVSSSSKGTRATEAGATLLPVI